MVQPIYHVGVVLFGDEGRYTLIEKIGDKFIYTFEPWNGEPVEKKGSLDELSEILKRKLIWAGWD